MIHRIALAVLLAASMTAQAQPLPEGFGWFASLSGSCWSGTFPDGKTSHRQCYTTQFGRFMRGTATLLSDKEGKPVPSFSGDSVFGWNDSKGTIDYFIWGSDGSYRQLEARYVEDELHFPIPSRTDAQKIVLRSVWRRIDANSFEVRQERPQGSEWRIDLVVTYRRDGPAPQF